MLALWDGIKRTGTNRDGPRKSMGRRWGYDEHSFFNIKGEIDNFGIGERKRFSYQPCYVIGSVVGIGDIVPVMSTAVMQSEILGRVEERDGYEANQVKIELFSPQVKVVSIAKFFHGAINRMDSHCIIYARIHRIYKEHGWAYTACKSCNKKVDILTRQNHPPVYVCEEHGNVQPASMFKVIVRVIDNSSSAPLLFFNNNFVKLSGYIAWELIEKYNMDPDEYCHEELDNIVVKKYLFKLFYLEYNVAKNNHTYRCDSFSKDVKLINHFKNNFIDIEMDDEEPIDELAESTTKKNKAIIKNSSDEHDSNMHIASKTRDSTSNVNGSSSKKRKLIIDLDDVESEPEEEGNISKTHVLVAVKMEPED
ncbi:replication protein A 70 kDa DNA-binding subunit B [Tanacetum coccineum]